MWKVTACQQSVSLQEDTLPVLLPAKPKNVFLSIGFQKALQLKSKLFQKKIVLSLPALSTSMRKRRLDNSPDKTPKRNLM